jgi:anti-sigma factor (TIGR02949 family)
MSDCSSIDPLITPYVDGDIDAAERQRVDAHLRACPPCHSRVAAEHAIRELVRTRRASFRAESAPSPLRDRCAAFRTAGAEAWRGRAAGASWRTRVAPLALAATLVIVVAGAFMYVSTDRSTRVLVAELTVDHAKCFGVMNVLLGTSADRVTIESAMASTFGWQMHMPEIADGSGFELVGARRCLYARGKMAHLMYRHNGHPFSIYMIPNMTRPAVPGTKDEVVDVMGYEATLWSSDGRTIVVVAREPQADVAQVVSFVQAGLR